jgi:hypothetical protein
MNFRIAVELILVALCAGSQMSIDKITVINHCAQPVYFAQSNPRNAKIEAGDTWSADWQIGGENVAGRLGFSYFAETFAAKNAGNANDNAWIELAADLMKPGMSIPKKNLNFANQQGIIDLDIEAAALDSNGNLVCPDAKARTALDPNACSGFTDGSARLEQFKGQPFCNFVIGANSQTCSTSDKGKYACTSAFASSVSDHSMLWKSDGLSATEGHWMAQPRSTGRSSGTSGFPSKPAKYEDHFVGRPTTNGRVGCDEHANGGQAVNFECFESCCYPAALGHPSVERQKACEAVGGVTAGTQGFVSCQGEKGDIHIANLQIVMCPDRSKLSSSNVKMPSCPSGAPQNPPTWSPNPSLSSQSLLV